MTIPADIAFEGYTIAGAATPLSFPHQFEFNDEIVIFANGNLRTLGVHYTLSGAGNPAGGTITPIAATVGHKWKAYRMTRLSQTSNPADPVVGFGLDRVVRIAQDARRDTDRAIKVDYDADFQTTISTPSVPGSALVVNETGDGFEFTSTAVGDDLDTISSDLDAVQSGLAAEIIARQNADAGLVISLGNEVVNRTAAIAAEAQARALADGVLMTLITGGVGDPDDVKLYLGLDEVDNTSDLDKPVSTATSGAITVVSNAAVAAQADATAALAGLTTKLNASAVSAFALTLLDDADASAFLTTLGISAFVKTLLDDAAATNFLTTLGFSTYGKTLIDDADASAAQTTLGISTFIKTLLDDADASAAQTTLGISTFVKTILDDAAATNVLTTLGVSTFIKTLLDDADATTALATLGAPAITGGTFTPVVTSSAGTITTVGATSGRWSRIGDMTYLRVSVNITTNGTGAGVVQATLPGVPLPALSTQYIGRDGTNHAIIGLQNAGVGSLSIVNYDATYPGASGAVLIVNGSFFN